MKPSCDINETSREVFVDVLERSAFMFGDLTDPSDLPALDGGAIAVSMRFQGPMSGEVTIAAPESMSIELAANAMGVECGEVEASHAVDALKELLNVTCGCLTAALAGDTPAFALTVPDSQPCHGDIWTALCSEEHSQAFNVDGYPVALRVVLDEVGGNEAATGAVA